MRAGLGRLLHASLVVLLSASVVLAQPTGDDRLPRRGPSTRAAAVPPIRLTVAAFGGYHRLAADDESRLLPRWDVYAGLGITRKTRRNEFDISAGSSFRFDGRAAQAGTQTVTAAMTSILGRRTRMAFVERAAQAPFDVLFAENVTGTLPMAGLHGSGGDRHDDRLRSLGGDLRIERVLDRMTTASAFARHDHVDAGGSAPSAAVGAGIRIERRVTGSSRLQAEYELRIPRLNGDAEPRQQRFDLGLQFARPLPFAGGAVLTIAPGASVVTQGRDQRIRGLFTADLSRTLGDRWHGRLSYSRPLQILAGIAEPLLSNTAVAELRRPVGRGMELTLSAFHTRGALGVAGRGRFRSTAAEVAVRQRLTRAWALDAYVYAANYRFSSTDDLRPGIPSERGRHGVRLGLSWLSPFAPQR